MLVLLFAVPAWAEPAKGSAAPDYERFRGKPIGEIRIVVDDIFERPDNLVYEKANQVKVKTRDEVVRREVLLKEGAEFDPFLLQESERQLRQLGYLREVRIKPIDRGSFVDVEVHVQDTWTIIPQFSFSSGTGKDRLSAGVADSNVLGYGKRAEVLYGKEDSLNSVEAVWDDPRVGGTKNQLTMGAFSRTDGDSFVLLAGQPFRNLVQDNAFGISINSSDIIDRLFRNGDERFIFRENRTDLSGRYFISRGSPEQLRHRFGFGYGYFSSTFEEADAEDYADLKIDPNTLEDGQVPEDRRFSGPILSYDEVEPNYISMNYVDRFDRVEDYNLGEEISVVSQYAPEALGSIRDTYIFSASRSHGTLVTDSAFIRHELSASSRIDEDGFANSIFHGEVKFFNVMGLWQPGGMYLGRHTLASALSLDYADDMDLDREFLAGSDNATRGYEARTFTGDKRLILNLEDRVHFADDVFQLISVGGAAFFDVGGATTDALGNLVTDGMYSTVGVGLRLGFPRSSGGKVFRIDIAVPLRDGPDGSGAFEPRLIFSGGQLFNARMNSEAVGSERANVAIGQGY